MIYVYLGNEINILKMKNKRTYFFIRYKKYNRI